MGVNRSRLARRALGRVITRHEDALKYGVAADLGIAEKLLLHA